MKLLQIVVAIYAIIAQLLLILICFCFWCYIPNRWIILSWSEETKRKKGCEMKKRAKSSKAVPGYVKVPLAGLRAASIWRVPQCLLPVDTHTPEPPLVHSCGPPGSVQADRGLLLSPCAVAKERISTSQPASCHFTQHLISVTTVRQVTHQTILV